MDIHRSTTIHFDTAQAAAAGLLAVVLDSRTSTSWYRFGGLTAESVLSNGLRIEGDIESIASKLEKLPGAARYDD